MDTTRIPTKSELANLLIREHVHVMMHLRVGVTNTKLVSDGVSKEICARVFDMHSSMHNNIFRGKPWSDTVQYWRSVTNA